MKKPILFFMVMLLALAAQAFFISCNSDISSDPDPTYYTVTFHKNYAGAEPSTTSARYEAGKSAFLRSESRKGYKFLGWAKKADAAATEYKAGDSVKVESNLAFYALWKKVDSFKVTFDAGFIKDGESAAETKMQTVTVSSSSDKFILDKNTFTRDGYVFAGWSKTKTSSYDSYKIAYKDAENVEYFYEDTTLYALWLEQSKSIKITYNKNDGTATPEEISYYVEKGKSFTLKANTFTRDGKTFAGWSKSKSSKKKEYADKAEIWSFYADSDITLYALWHDDAHYVITYYSNFEGSTYDYKEQTLEKSESGATGNLLKNTFERTGYVFYGWYTSSNFPKTYGTKSDFYTDESKITLTEDKDLYACWLEDKSSEAVKLTFNKNDGTATPEETSQYVKYGSKPSYSYSWSDTNYNKLKPNTFTRENYEFLGWANSSYATSAAYTDAQTDVYFTANTTLYAVWQYKGPVVITFDGNGGKDSDGNTTATQTITANTYTELKANTFAKENYGFAGWAKTNTATYREYDDKESVKFSEPTVTLYAVWKPNPVITFNGNGGTTSGGETTATQSIPYGVSTALNENPFTKAGSTFIGWNKYASGTYAHYSDKGSISIYGDTTLYAIWKDDIVLTFNANGGVGSDITKNVAYDTASSSYKFTVPENTFTRAGYVFMGWGTSASSTSDSYKAGESASAQENKTLYAIWAKESVTVTFDPNTENGGSGTSFTQNLLLNTTTLKYEGTLPANTFTNSNGDFVGWSTYKKPSSTYSIMSAGLAVSLSYSQLPNSEGFTLYAVWNPKTYTVTYKLGGNGTDIVKTVTNTAEYGKRMDYTLEAAPASELSYYSFIGWSNYNGITYPGLSAGQTIQLDEDETIYAVWKLGTILDTSGTLSSNSQESFSFKLLKETRLVFTATASGSNGLDFWLYNSKNEKISDKTKLTSETYTLNLKAGTYELVINNGNIFNTKSYTIKIEPAN
ncbi:MAG: InlB B-repeat-containing protein [Treponema sp.]